jgi:hypothetical protein
MKNNNLPRSTRRRYLTKTGYYKRIAGLRLNHEDKVAHRELMRTQGEEAHKKNVEAIQERLSETLAPAETKIMEILNSKGLDKAEIDAYMTMWVDVNFWPRPKDYHVTRRALRKLNKKYGI